MKIGLLIFSKQWSGAEKFVYYLAKNLLNDHFEVYVFTNSEVAKYYSGLGCQVYDIGSIFSNNGGIKPYSLLNATVKIYQYFKKLDLDILHLNLEIGIVVGTLINKFLNIPSIITLHGTEFITAFEKNNSFYKKIISRLLNYSFAKTDILISPNESRADKINKYPVRVIPNGFDISIFHKNKVRESNKSVLFVGQFIEMKGIKELINVAKQLPQYEFWFAGQGTLSNIIKGKNVKNLGFKSQKELVKLYNKATICAFPSYHENFPTVGLEAMACGKAVITTPLGFSEYIENNKDGLIVPSKNVNALKQAIYKLISDKKLREKIGKKAMIKVKKFEWKNIIPLYERVYKEVLKKHENKH